MNQTIPAARATPRRSRELSERALGIVMLAPMLLVLLLVIGYPLLDSFWLSLHRANLASPEQGQPFVGLSNYLYAFRQPDFWYSVQRTLYFTILSVALELVLGIVFAVLLNERFRGNLGARLAMIFPWALLTVSNGVLWAWILNPTYGVANGVLLQLGLLDTPKSWLSDTFWTMNVIILADAWKTVPNMTLLLLAGLQPISADLYEAAEVDGATRWQKFTGITLPLLRPVILVAVALRTIGAFKVFDIIYVLTGNGGPANSTKVIAFYDYDQAFHYLFFGYGAAISWLITAFMLVMIVIYIRLLRSDVGAWRSAVGSKQLAVNVAAYWLLLTADCRLENEMVVRRGNLLSPTMRWALLLIYLVFTLLPLVWLFLSTIQTQASLLTLPVRIIPSEVSWQNYIDIFKPAAFGENSGQSTFLLSIRNSVIVSLGTTAVSMVFGTLAAYAFARFNIPRKRTLLLIVLGSQLLPAISLIIPLFRMFKGAGLLDSLTALILAYSTFSMPFVVWIMAGYFQSVPIELEEAARMDGASRFQAFIRVALPLAAPGLAATAIFTLLNAWDEFFFALIFTSTYSAKTVPVALAEFIGRHNVNWGLLVTGGFIASLPPIVLSLAFYRYIVSGLSAGGLKG